MISDKNTDTTKRGETQSTEAKIWSFNEKKQIKDLDNKCKDIASDHNKCQVVNNRTSVSLKVSNETDHNNTADDT